MDQIETPLELEVRHAPQSVARRVRAWFDRTTDGHRLGILDGSRSVLLPHPDKRGTLLKIKGAGLRGEGIRFGRYLRSGPMAVTFDFDGRMMEDVASGHDNAMIGGASFQQASTEYLTSRLLHEAGHPVVPCLGFGSLSTPAGRSWFSVFEWQRGWSSISISSDFSLEQFLATRVDMSRHNLEVAVRHHLIGYFTYVHDPDGTCIIKDVHPFRRLDPINHSQLSWTLELLQAMWVRCSSCRFVARAGGAALDDDELAAAPLRALVTGADGADYRAFETMIVEPWLHRRPDASFSSDALYDALQSVRVGAAALALCPPDYTRLKS